MSVTQQAPSMQAALPLYLLAIRGTLASDTLEDARLVHNETAGTPMAISAAQSLGDLSHMVYIPLNLQMEGAGELLILDIWNSLDGLGQFFANPQVQEDVGRNFRERDPVVFAPAAGFFSYHFPAPYGNNDRIVAVVRGTVHSRKEAMEVHNAIIASQINKARLAGSLSHEAYFSMGTPDNPETLEFFAVDTWMDATRMRSHYEDPVFLNDFQKLFAAPPVTSVWTHPMGNWVEW